jgi:hypothetical protein
VFILSGGLIYSEFFWPPIRLKGIASF